MFIGILLFNFEQIEEIDHSISSWISGDYFRLLTPGTYTVTVTADGYEKSTQVVRVDNNNGNGDLSAMVVNFTLEKDHSSEWSALNDFSIGKNLESKYLSNQEIVGEESFIRPGHSYFPNFGLSPISL